MGEKVYKPILGEGEHLLSSTDNPGRVRGLSRDENNQNPGIPEFEEYDIDDFRNDSDAQVDDDSAREISELLAMIAVPEELGFSVITCSLGGKRLRGLGPKKKSAT